MGPRMKPLGIYIHIPYCVERCSYCGFYSNAVGRDLDSPELYIRESKYVADTVLKLREYAGRYSDDYLVDTIYLGGGTPTILPLPLLRNLIESVRKNFEVTEDAEITIEANPKTIDAEKLRGLRECGVNRLSIGLQSYSPDVLKTLGRIHTAADFEESFFLARYCGYANISCDLMFGIPGQTMKEWLDSVDRLIRLEPEHISFYSLQLEEGTPLYDAYRRGDLPELNDRIDRAMYHRALRRLIAAGYEHYEISNAAKPGFACRHNLKYWTFEDYLGIGASASSFMGGVRFRQPPEPENHVNSFMDDAGEYVFTGLRLAEGISKRDFAERFGRGFWDVFGDRRDELQKFFDRGYLLEEGDRLKLSEKGIDRSNRIMAVFV